MRTVIFAGGTIHPGQWVTEAITQADVIIAADSGLMAVLDYGCRPDYVVGDFDSLLPSLQDYATQNSRVIRANTEKDETDTELAIQTAVEQGASEITLLGALGGERLEHSIANILLLAAYPDISLRIVDGPSRAWLLHGPGTENVTGTAGDLLSLLPITGAVHDMYTRNLYYPLQGDTLYFGKPRGVSNVFIQDNVDITIGSGLLMLVHTRSNELRN